MTDRFDHRTSSIIEQYFGIPASEQESLVDGLVMQGLAGGDWLFHQGEPAEALYILVRGRLQVWLEQEGGDALESPVLIGRVTPGDSVGELALLTGANRSAGIRAVRDSVLIRINRKSFDDLGVRHPRLLMKLAERAAHLAQQPPVAGAGPTRNLSTIAVVPLDSTPRCMQFCDELAAGLSRQGEIRWLQNGDLDHECDDDGSIPAEVAQEIHQLEDETRLLVFHCDAAASSWTRFCLRQSDLVVLVADASSDPVCRDWELELSLLRSDATARRVLVLLQPDSSQDIQGTSRWFEHRQVDFHLHVRADKSADLDRVARVLMGNAVGLVFGAGASRGFAHLGVIKALEEAGMPIDWFGGASIGAIMGSTSAMGWPIERCIDLMRKAFVRGRPFSDYTMPLISLLSGGRMQRLLRQHADVQIEDMPLPFFCISSSLDDGSSNLHKRGSLARALQATASMPGILPPTVVNGRLAVDGAVLDSLPIDLMWQQPVGRVFAVSLSSHKQTQVDYKDTPSAWAVLRSKFLPFTPRYRVPAMMTVVLKATELATMASVKAQSGRANLLFEPDVRRFGLTQVNAFDRIVKAGYDCAQEVLRNKKICN